MRDVYNSNDLWMDIEHCQYSVVWHKHTLTESLWFLQSCLIMTQWQHMSHIIQMSLSDEAVNNLYPQNAFPIEVRHFLAEWIENQRW